jgi:chromosome segregation ATPase
LDKSNFKVDSYAFNPLEVGNKRETLFGKMSYIDTKPRYYGSSFTLDQATVKRLLERCKVKNNHKEDAYQALHGLAKKRVGESERFILEKSWSEYVNHSSVKTYKKDELLQYEKDGILQVNVEQVRRDSRAIATQELGLKTKKQVDKHKIQIYENLKELQDHEERLEILEFIKKKLDEQLQENGKELQDHEERLEILEFIKKKLDEQLQENGKELQDHEERLEILEFIKKKLDEQLQENGKEPQGNEKRLKILKFIKKKLDEQLQDH